LVNSPQARRLPSPIQAIVAGAAPTASLLSSLERLNFRVTHVYGLTETYGPFTRNYDRPEYANLSQLERAKIYARQGHAFAQADEVRVVKVDNEGRRLVDLVDCDFMEPGEVVTRGNIVMKEVCTHSIRTSTRIMLLQYFKDPNATAEAFLGGYFASGDIAVKFPDGSISIQDRSKDVIISGGEASIAQTLSFVLLQNCPVERVKPSN